MIRSFTVTAAVLLAGCVHLQAQLYPPLPEPLVLPADLGETLPLSRQESFLVDALRVVDCPRDEDNPLGTCGDLIFGSRVMIHGHLEGMVHIKFAPPVDEKSRFEIRLPGGLTGEDTFLQAPNLFEFKALQTSIDDDPELVSFGLLNLETGEVTELTLFVRVFHTGIAALKQANPTLEAPLTITFPGVYGSAFARFEQRGDGLLDFELSASTFLPLGNDLGGRFPRFPMPFCDPELNCATIPAPGTALNPHLTLSTKAEAGVECGENCPQIPTNTVWQFDTSTHNTSFGDAFSLNIPQLGGPTTGRSQLVGRMEIQFGDRVGDTVPFFVRSLPPTATFAEPPDSPLSLPGISIGLIGHSEFLRFPLQTYFLNDVAFADDPFDVALGSVDVKTGEVVGGLLYRGFIAQNLLFALLDQNDGRIQASSFLFRGPARFEKGAGGQTIFRFDGLARLSFDGFTFPSPDLVREHAFTAGAGSTLEPFLRIRAMHPEMPSAFIFSGNRETTSSSGDDFTYTYTIPCDAVGQSFSFEYRNIAGPEETRDFRGAFHMQSPASVSCFNSRNSESPAGAFDSISFSGFGTWSGDDSVHLASVQISTAPDAPYVSILIDGGRTSNVDTKPENIDDTLP